MAKLSTPLWGWRNAIASANGPKSATTRHVLLVLSFHMHDDGTQAWPSTRKLAERTGLSERAVCEHLGRAEAEGWIERRRRGLPERGWIHEYTAMVPPMALTDGQHHGTDGESAPRGLNPDVGADPHADGADSHALGTDSDDTMALTESQRKFSVKSQESSQETSPLGVSAHAPQINSGDGRRRNGYDASGGMTRVADIAPKRHPAGGDDTDASHRVHRWLAANPLKKNDVYAEARAALNAAGLAVGHATWHSALEDAVTRIVLARLEAAA